MLLHKDSLQVAKACSTDPTRYALQGMRIEPDGTTVATDGHILVRYRLRDTIEQAEYPMIDGFSPADETEELAPCTIPMKDVLAIAKMVPKSKHCLPVLEYVALDVPRTNANGSAFFATTDLENVKQASPKKIEYTFPDYLSCMPDPPSDETPTMKVGFTIDVLLKALETLKACQVKSVEMELRDPLSPVELCGHAEHGEVYALVMPCRDAY